MPRTQRVRRQVRKAGRCSRRRPRAIRVRRPRGRSGRRSSASSTATRPPCGAAVGY